MLDERGLPLDLVMRARVEEAWGGPDEVPETITPGCFPSKARFVAWLRSWTKEPMTFCTDCTAQRKAAMVAQHRCAFVDVTFDVDSDGWTRGNRA